jgi:hypothetical protein
MLPLSQQHTRPVPIMQNKRGQDTGRRTGAGFRRVSLAQETRIGVLLKLALDLLDGV